MLARLTPAKQALLDAAQYIRDHGWCQGRFYDGDRVCLLGALIVSTQGRQEYAAAAAALYQANGPVSSDAHDWNDAPGRTKEEVIAALEQAALT